MRLTKHDLKQIDEDYLASLSPEQLLSLSKRMLDDLRDARDRLNQNSHNSSRPSGSFAPWEQANHGGETKQLDERKNAAKNEGAKNEAQPSQKEALLPQKTTNHKRKRGKQKGSKGIGRHVELAITGQEIHQPSHCAGCGEPLAEGVGFKAQTGLHVLDIVKGAHGIQLTHVKHLYGSSSCLCGHVTQTEPGRCPKESGWTVRLTEWHLVGSTLASLIICLSLRMRLSRRRIREFLQDWLGISLSVGCINQCIIEGGRAVAPLEDVLVAEIEQAALLHVDETGWKESGRTVWLWVLRTATVTLYMIGSRSWHVIADALEQFAGWLMSDGYPQYRHYGKRLRCLAHLIRKARGLADSCHPEVATFGEKVLEMQRLFIKGIYAARGDPSRNLPQEFSTQLAAFKQLCEQHRDHEHDKVRKLAREFLNDWEAIWQVLTYPHLPITNNIAEQSLRHWVIARKISYGTRTPEGSRAFALLASVIDTCRQRGVSPWPYIAEIIAARRKGNPVPPLPTG